MQEQLEQIKQLTQEQVLSNAQKIAIVYRHYFGGEICLSCQKSIFSYWQKLLNFQPKHTEPMNKQTNFKLREELASLQMDFGSSEFFTNDTLTDEIALRYLKINKNRIANFSEYPSNWQELFDNFGKNTKTNKK